MREVSIRDAVLRVLRFHNREMYSVEIWRAAVYLELWTNKDKKYSLPKFQKALKELEDIALERGTVADSN